MAAVKQNLYPVKEMKMAIQTPHNHEISDDFVDTLRNAYITDKSEKISVCDQSETAIAYALKETSVADNGQFVQHLRSCRDCLALVFDVRLSLEEAANQTKASTKPDTQMSTPPALPKASDAVQLPTDKPQSLASRWISYFLSPKLIAGLATCSIIVFIMMYYPAEKKGVEDIERIRKKITHSSSPQKPATKIYNLRANPDNSSKLKSSVKPGKKMKSPLISPLEKTALKKIKLKGVMLSDSGNIAIVKGPHGKEYIVAKGTRIGNNSGRVILITGHKIIVEEQQRDKNGEIKKVRKVLVMPGDKPL